MFEDESFDATIAGRIADETGAPVAGALVIATFPESADRESLTTSTDEVGQYVLRLSADAGESISLVIQAEFNDAVIGARDVTVSEASPTRENVDFVLAEDSDLPTQPSRESGTVSQIVVAEQSGTVLRVRESGGPETVSITFVAVDSIGRRADELEQAVQL